MTERKQQLYTMADGFVALPGGLGTLEETIEVISWSNIRLHQKPVAMLNLDGYYNLLDQFVRHIVQEDFAAPEALALYGMFPTPEACVEYLEQQFSSAAAAPSTTH
jgi:uncharacterized protein (TIGR00730 family)